MICTCSICGEEFEDYDFYTIEYEIEDLYCTECAEIIIEWIIKRN
jgi:hypothetical protein